MGDTQTCARLGNYYFFTTFLLLNMLHLRVGSYFFSLGTVEAILTLRERLTRIESFGGVVSDYRNKRTLNLTKNATGVVAPAGSVPGLSFSSSPSPMASP